MPIYLRSLVMAHVLSSPFQSYSSDVFWQRSTALGLALAGNALMLMLLSLPRDDDFNPYLPTLEEPPPDIPEVVTRAQPTAVPPPPMPSLPAKRPPPRDAVISTIVDKPTSTLIVAASEPLSDREAIEGEQIVAPMTTDPAPAAELSLGYDVAPPPPYPLAARRRGLQGTVILRVLVGADGRPREVQVARSSGHRELDRAAERQVIERWRFIPATRDGQRIEAWARVPLQFTLQRG